MENSVLLSITTITNVIPRVLSVPPLKTRQKRRRSGLGSRWDQITCVLTVSPLTHHRLFCASVRVVLKINLEQLTNKLRKKKKLVVECIRVLYSVAKKWNVPWKIYLRTCLKCDQHFPGNTQIKHTLTLRTLAWGTNQLLPYIYPFNVWPLLSDIGNDLFSFLNFFVRGRRQVQLFFYIWNLTTHIK